ncbi:hypothetical protein BK816_05565 [Boudabousia tangfeifanii]|uniref:Glycosyl hydrolase family 13 catalytic domain-containing protein n=1 Tax=Boudabousia tangfeifanii TaxID=1912795 RepID=A0A1D9MKS1_9ACTO|nr:alpha-amylase family glycosyl hydrolase [Boudabousia tangfeifanii]AOZ72828.1 hypothetical protein BK816_05565 [Boudabousia tangfeifanii]
MKNDGVYSLPPLPDWAYHAQWWHLYPLGALGADTTGQDFSCQATLRDLIPWLDHARDLGLNGLALGPIFKSELHGYDTISYFEIDPRIGTLEDFTALVNAAHERGFKIMLDGVFNHVSKNYEWHDTDPKEFLKQAEDGSIAIFEGHGQLQELDWKKTLTQDLVKEVLTFWTKLGVDAWRLDAAYALEGAELAKVISDFTAQHPQTFFVGEFIHGDYPQMLSTAKLQTCTQYELWKAIWSALKDNNLYELAWATTRHNAFLESFIPWTFIGNHDVTRIATQVGLPKAMLAVVLLATYPGLPAVYYGDELGFEGLKEERFGGDDAIRPRLPQEVPSDAERPEIFRHYQQLLGLRRRFPQIVNGRVQILAVAGSAYAYAVLDENQQAVLVVALNSGEQHASLPLGENLANLQKSAPNDQALFAPLPHFDSSSYLGGKDAGINQNTIELDPHTWMIWQAK